MDKQGDIIDMPASQFFDKYPPYFYIGDGELIYDGRSHTVDDEFDELPEECLIGSDLVDWSDCATWVEYDIDDKEDPDVEGLIDVHQWTCDFIRDNGSEDQVIFYDQGSWEIADYVRMDPKSRTISFYHCKKAEKNKASGARIKSIQEVLDQVLRTVSWIADSRLPDEMLRRESDTQRSEFVQNNNSFQEIKAEFTPMEWTYEVYIIHPGIDYEDAKSSENINTILLTCVEWLEAAGASFRLIGDPNKQVEAFVS